MADAVLACLMLNSAVSGYESFFKTSPQCPPAIKCLFIQLSVRSWPHIGCKHHVILLCILVHVDDAKRYKKFDAHKRCRLEIGKESSPAKPLQIHVLRIYGNNSLKVCHLTLRNSADLVGLNNSTDSNGRL